MLPQSSRRLAARQPRNNNGGAMARRLPICLLVSALTSVLISPAASAETLLDTAVQVLVDGGNDFAWEKVEPAGASCGDGSRYKFFVHRTGSPNLLFMFEGG